MTDSIVPTASWVKEINLQSIGSRVRRALRNERGVNLTFEHLQQLAICNRLQPILEFEDQELCRVAQVHTRPGIAGSKSGGTELLPQSGKSHESQSVGSYIAALTAKA